MIKQKFTYKRIIGFGIVLALLLVLISLPFQKLEENGYDYKNVLNKAGLVAAEKKDSIDVLFLGDSEAWATFAPLQFYNEYGFTSYNCAFPGQWTYDSLAVLKKTLQYQNPSTVVLEANLLYSAPNVLKFNLFQYFPVFHSHGYYKMLGLKHNPDKSKGANINSQCNAYTGDINYMSKKVKRNKFHGKNLEYLNELLSYCKEKNIQVIIVSSVSALNWTEGKHLGVQAWCDEKDVTYIDYNEPENYNRLSFDWSTDTRDKGDHVNQSGSDKICSDFGKILVEKYALPDHRQDVEYSSWQSIYNEKYTKG